MRLVNNESSRDVCVKCFVCFLVILSNANQDLVVKRQTSLDSNRLFSLIEIKTHAVQAMNHLTHDFTWFRMHSLRHTQAVSDTTNAFGENLLSASSVKRKWTIKNEFECFFFLCRLSFGFEFDKFHFVGYFSLQSSLFLTRFSIQVYNFSFAFGLVWERERKWAFFFFNLSPDTFIYLFLIWSLVEWIHYTFKTIREENNKTLLEINLRFSLIEMDAHKLRPFFFDFT